MRDDSVMKEQMMDKMMNMMTQDEKMMNMMKEKMMERRM
jgi:hypothetical protein